MEARSKGSVGPFWPLRLHFLPVKPNDRAGLVLTKVSCGMESGYWTKTMLGYCRTDALMTHRFIVHLWPLTLWYCKHFAVSLLCSIFLSPVSCVLVAMQLYQQHFSAMNFTVLFSFHISAFFSLQFVGHYFFILATDCLFLIALHENPFVCRNSGNFACFTSEPGYWHRKWITFDLSLFFLVTK